MDLINPDRCDTTGVVDWLIDGARSAPEPHQVLEQCCERLIDCGIPLWRVAVFVRTLHPNIPGRAFVWRRDGPVQMRPADFELFESEEFRNSPVAGVHQGGVAIRRRIADRDCPMDFAVLGELRGEGVTDYLASPLFFTNGAIQVATFTTRRPGGFTEPQIAGLEAILSPLARVAEVRALRREAVNLLDTYVGHQAGTRILDGQIRRGHFEAIEAAIWLSDMRGFTASADRLPLTTLIDLLNRYFDCQVPAILEAGGEVLKFMGDGLLAIFPVDGGDLGPACARALAAALDARERVAKMPAPEGLAGGDGVRFGLALHVGEVLYGNVGSGNRLDFTCIGPAVNLAARLEGLAGKLGRTIVASGDFAAHCPGALEPIGAFEVAGLSAAQPVFAIEESGAPRQESGGAPERS
jgi:adenylate cyclase